MGTNPSEFRGANKPVENVSWDDCLVFISRLNALTGEMFRLPTEAEWEFAARGGNYSRHYRYSGSDTLEDVACCYEDSTYDAATKKANELGLYDMSGNVYEWCSDWYEDYSGIAQYNPTGAKDGELRVTRGGCWVDSELICRSSFRQPESPKERSNMTGLRLVLSE